VVVSRGAVRSVTATSREREETEANNRKQLQAAQLGIDIYGMRDKLKTRGLRYVKSAGELKK
jgi:4-hydroxy-4-methyl-2-oxoglutarate aldolase